MIRKVLIGIIAGALFSVVTYGQFADCSTGLLQAPTAEMQPDGTFMITNNFLNRHSLPSSGWDYNTFQYGIYVSFWERIEIGYVCTIFNGRGAINRIKRNMNELCGTKTATLLGASAC